MIVRSLDVKKHPFCPPEEGEDLHNPEVLYLSAIGDLTYFANCRRRDIAFSVSLLAKYCSTQLGGTKMVSNTYHQSSSAHMSSRRDAMLIFSKYSQVTIWQIYSQKRCQHRNSRS